MAIAPQGQYRQLWRRFIRSLGCLVVGLVLISIGACSTAFPSISVAYKSTPPSQDGIGKVYLGREIARTMGHEGAAWLDRPSRILQERPNAAIDALQLQPTDVVADIGAGSGYFATRLAFRVSEGRVLAVDVQPEMLDLLQQKLTDQHLENVELVLGQPDSPNLAPDSIDLAIMVDAYHEFAYPYEMMQGIVTALRPGGRVVLAEYRAENPLIMIKRLHKMSEAQVKREMAVVGLEWLKTEEILPQQHLLFFRKPA
jgi:ubiquinone/menaquinone biosynthesis C-methylase UbiE